MLQATLQTFLNKGLYSDLFKELSQKLPASQGHEFEKLRNELIGGHINVEYNQRVDAFVYRCLSEEREKMNLVLDEAILQKEQRSAQLDEQIAEQEECLDSLSRRIKTNQKNFFELDGLMVRKRERLKEIDDQINKKIEHLQSIKEVEAEKGYENFKSGIATIDYLVQANPSSARGYFDRGCAYEKQGYAQHSIEDFSSAIDANPTFVDAFMRRGMAKLSLGMWEDAIIDFLKVSDLGAKSCLYLILYRPAFDIAFCHAKLENRLKTLEYLTLAVEQDAKRKTDASKEPAFQWLWADPDFKKLVK